MKENGATNYFVKSEPAPWKKLKETVMYRNRVMSHVDKQKR